MEEASKRFLSSEDRLKSLLLRFDNDLVELLLRAAEDDKLLEECLSREFEGVWELHWIKESKCPHFTALIPLTSKPSFFGAAISVLNNRGHKATVLKYLEIFSSAPYQNFYAQKHITKHITKLIESEKENTAAEDQLFLRAQSCAEKAAKYHHTPGYFLLAYLHYFMAQRRKELALQHYEMAYKSILIGEQLAPHSDKSIQGDYSELSLISKISEILKTTVFTVQGKFEKARAESSAAKEAKEIIEFFYARPNPLDNPRYLTL